MKLPIRLSKESREPIYHQIEYQIKTLIAAGHLTAGDALPSIRILSKDLQVSIITTRRAYQDLEQQGYIKTEQGKGTFVAQVAAKEKQEVKENAVQQSISAAIETAMNYDYTFAQIEKMFLRVLDQKRKELE